MFTMYRHGSSIVLALKILRNYKAITRRQNNREPTQFVRVADCYFIVNVLDLPFASPRAIYC